MPASTTTVLNFRGYQSGWFYLNYGQPLLLSRSVWLNLSESMLASTTTVLNFKGYQFGWIWLNQCQPALQLYWISEAISLADSVWIMDSQYLDCSEFLSLSVWLNLFESMPASIKTVLDFRAYKSEQILLNQCQPALQLYWISKAISLADSVWIMDSQYLDCSEFPSLSVWLVWINASQH